VSKFARNAATTFAPRASTATKNPAYKGKVVTRLKPGFPSLLFMVLLGCVIKVNMIIRIHLGFF